MKFKYLNVRKTKRQRIDSIRRRNIENKLENGEELTEGDLRSTDDILADIGDAECHREREEGKREI